MTETKSNLLAHKYRIEAVLGRGGMAEVYKVWDPDRRASVAMKVLHEHLADDPVFLGRFQREARTLAKLEHPNIVRFFEFAHVGELAFMLMEYIEGTTLSHVKTRLSKPFTPGQILWILKPVCAALHFAHGKGLVHCDIKSGNIMIDSTGKIMLADFGIARSTDAATVTTMAGAGTPAYMSPEQIIGADPTPQMDIYALGVVMFDLATGKLPFTGERTTTRGTNAEKIRWEKRNMPPPSPHEYNPKISPALEVVILRCLATDPAKRYKSVANLLEGLTAAVGVPAEPLPRELLVRGERASEAIPGTVGGLQIPRWWFVIAGIVLLGAVALTVGLAGAFMFGNANRPGSTVEIPTAQIVTVEVMSTLGPVTPTLPPTATVPPPTPTEYLPAATFTHTNKGYELAVHGGPDRLDRVYKGLPNGFFKMAETGNFGVFVSIEDHSGIPCSEVYVVNFSKTAPFLLFNERITRNDFWIFDPVHNPSSQNPDYELELLTDDQETYHLIVRELTFGQNKTITILRPMSNNPKGQ